MYEEDTPEPRPYGFIVGMAMGTIVGAGLMMWLTPRSTSELGRRVRNTAREFGEQASDHLRQTIAEAVGQVTRKGQNVRKDVAGAVARGAHEVERFAKAAASDAGRQ